MHFSDVDCGKPEHIQHGRYTLTSNATYYGAAALYECDGNFELDGFARRLCLENGTWSSDTPVCKGKTKLKFNFKLLQNKCYIYNVYDYIMNNKFC